VPDPVARDLEGEHRREAAVLPRHQAGQAVDRALDERRAVARHAGDLGVGACDPLAADDRVQVGDDQPATVGGRGRLGVEQADQGVNVLGLPRRFEPLDNGRLPGTRACRRLRKADATAGGRGQLTARRRSAADDLGDLAEGVAEHVVQDERGALGRGHRIENDQEGHRH
jgi:hypothetical protein